MKRIVVTLAAILPMISALNASAEVLGIETETRNEIAVSLASYSYEEPGLMSLKGLKSGIELRTTRAYPARHTFLRGELRYAGGTVDYSSNGTGSSSGEPDWYFEGRALVGRDWLLDESTISSFIGLGYRFLFNDGRGITSTGHAGYRRESNYVYLPLGIIYRAQLGKGAELVSSIEYDHLLSGTQFTMLSDVGSGYANLSNKQSEGGGLKLHLMYTMPEWSAGPYLHYWNIADSDVAPIYRNGIIAGYGLEPHNKTLEFGIELRRPF
jgi:hypothetical protein